MLPKISIAIIKLTFEDFIICLYILILLLYSDSGTILKMVPPIINKIILNIPIFVLPVS